MEVSSASSKPSYSKIMLVTTLLRACSMGQDILQKKYIMN